MLATPRYSVPLPVKQRWAGTVGGMACCEPGPGPPCPTPTPHAGGRATHRCCRAARRGPGDRHILWSRWPLSGGRCPRSGTGCSGKLGGGAELGLGPPGTRRMRPARGEPLPLRQDRGRDTRQDASGLAAPHPVPGRGAPVWRVSSHWTRPPAHSHCCGRPRCTRAQRSPSSMCSRRVSSKHFSGGRAVSPQLPARRRPHAGRPAPRGAGPGPAPRPRTPLTHAAVLAGEGHGAGAVVGLGRLSVGARAPVAAGAGGTGVRGSSWGCAGHTP